MATPTMIKSLLNFSFIFLFVASLSAQQSAGLVVFIQPGQTVSDHFITASLPAIEQYAQEQGLSLKVVDATKGAPAEITFTPQMVFQNHLGRSIYRGRYLTLDRLTNFIRTARNAPQEIASNPVRQFPIVERGRALIGSPIKVTPLQGTLPKGFDPSKFQEDAIVALASGFQMFDLKQQYDLPGQTRLFYMDFHPFLNAEGKLLISSKVFSMFSCVDAVYETDLPFEGSWENRKEVFRKAGQRIEGIVMAQLNNLQHGDAFEALPSEQAVKSWESLGLLLPIASDNALSTANFTSPMPSHWTFEQALPDGSPLVQFSFGAPVDHYAGEARTLSMQLDLTKTNSLTGATGFVVVQTKSITMGDEGLDDHIYNDYLRTHDFPNASYEFEISEAPESWDLAQPQAIVLTGTFTMLGKPIPLKAKGRVSAFAAPDGSPRLQIHGNLLLPLQEAFGIDGPDGPSPARDQLQFYLNLHLKATQKQGKIANRLFVAETPQQEEQVEVVSEIESTENLLIWHTSSPFYKANGSFDDWKVSFFELKNDQIETLKAEVVINMSSVMERSKMLVKHLKSEDYLDVEKFTQARVIIQHPIDQGNGVFMADGVITLMGITQMLPIYFEVLSYAPFTVKGTAVINRNDFGIGKGGKSKNIKEEVEIEFTWSADTI